MALVDHETLKRIIVHSDSKTLVAAAEVAGKALAQQHRLTTSQVRSIFGTVRQIEMDWLYSHQGDEQTERQRRAQRELQLLKPRIAYQAKRERGTGVSELSQVLTPAIDLVENDRQRFRNFVDFFEAILAYHKAFGGRDT